MSTELAHAKLTRSLRVVGRRPDGYHLLETEMLSLDLCDVLEIAEAETTVLELVDAVEWSGSGGKTRPVAAPGGADNLVVKALSRVGRSAAVRLVKAIPSGAGLGGGSSDAAAVLRWAGVSDVALAAALGADVPFCVRGGRAMVRGIGEQIEPLAVEDATFVLCTPAVAVSTAAVYRAYDELLLSGPVDGPNDLERAALFVEPRLARWRDRVAEVTGRVPVLAGSGASWFVECAADLAEKFRLELLAAVAEDGEQAVVRVAHSVQPRT